MKRRTGITLPEVMVWVILCGMACMAINGLFMLARSAQQTTISGYLVSGESDTALRWLRRDLQETALVSLRTYPNDAKKTEPPGCSLISARLPSDKDPKLEVSKYGTPFWAKHVFYSLKADAGARTGDLSRWEMALTDAQRDFVPRPTDLMPSSFSSNTNRRVLLHDVLVPKSKVPNLTDKADYQTDDYGGFQILFVQRVGGENGVEQYTSANPSENSQGAESANNTKLVKVRLEILADDKHRPSFYQLEFKVHPRY